MKKKPLLPFISILFCMAYSTVLFSQENYEIQVYGSDLVKTRTTMFEIHSNTSLHRMKGDHFFSQDYFRETLEITHGFTDWMELGSYLFTNVGIKGSTDIVGVHLRPRIAIPSSMELPVGLSLSSEIGWVKTKYSDSDWSLELRPIIDKKWDRLMLAFNTVFSLGLRDLSNQHMDFGSAFKCSYDATKKVALGLEYYGGYGALDKFLPVHSQQHQLFGVVDLNFGEDWEFNSGLGWSLNSAADRLILKFIVGRRFGF